jgi:hypothetical protein
MGGTGRAARGHPLYVLGNSTVQHYAILITVGTRRSDPTSILPHADPALTLTTGIRLEIRLSATTSFTECHSRLNKTLDNDLVYRERDTRQIPPCRVSNSPQNATLGKEPSAAVYNWRSLTLPSVFLDTRQNIYFSFFYFSHQTFCGLFLHYVHIHVQFWHIIKSVCCNY